MKKLAAALTLLATTAAVAGGQSIPDWVTFRSPEGRYFVILPAQPTLSAQEGVAATGDKFPQYFAVASDPESGVAYVVSYFDIPPTLTFKLTEGRDAAAKGFNGTVVGEMPVTLGGYAGLDATIAFTSGETDFISRCRFYLVEQRIYIVQAVVPKTAMSASVDKVEKYLESFKLTETPYSKR